MDRRRLFDTLGAIATVAGVSLMTATGANRTQRIMQAQSQAFSASIRMAMGTEGLPPAVGSAEWLRAVEHDLMIAGHEIDCPTCQAAEAARRSGARFYLREIAQSLRGNDGE